MKIKEIIYIIACLFVIYMTFISKNTVFIVIGSSIILIFFIYKFILSTLQWNKNKKEINTEYINFNKENFLLEFAVILNLYLKIKREYNYRDFYLEYFYNKIVEINNFKDFINTYDVIDQILIYLAIGIIIFFILSAIKKIVCRSRISSNKILFSDGKLINITEIKDVKVEDSFFGLSKKISLKLDNNFKIVYIKNDLFSLVRNDLSSLTNPNASETNN